MTVRANELTRGAARTSFVGISRRALHQFTCVAATAFILVAVICPPAVSGTVNYGDFFGDTVDFLNVQEQSSEFPDGGPGLYRTPTLADDALFFSPVGFKAESNLMVPAIDGTDGQLQMKVMGKNGNAITQIDFSESGLFDVAGFAGITTDETMVRALVVGNVTVLEVDGSSVIPLVIPLDFDFFFTPQGGLPIATNQWRFGIEGGTAGGSWTGDQLLNINQALTLAGPGYQFSLGATKIDINLDNRLLAKSQTTGTAYIDKKLFLEITTTVIPEPGTFALVVLAGLMLIGRRFGRSES